MGASGSSEGPGSVHAAVVVHETPDKSRCKFIEGGIIIEDSPATDEHGNAGRMDANLGKLQRMQQLRLEMEQAREALQRHPACIKTSRHILCCICMLTSSDTCS